MAGRSDHRGGVIAGIAPGSVAERLDLQPADELLAVNGRPPRDAIDVQFYAAEPRLELTLRRSGELFVAEATRRYGESLGLLFKDPIFDGVRRCNNRCEFCFVDQMPPGLRRSLYVKDDDYRLSFLSGSYVTLTNLSEADWRRIEDQHLSPLYVSVHATDEALRRHILRNPEAPPVSDQLRRLAAIGVVVHTQIVLRPGVNDGESLDRSIDELTGLYSAVQSVSIVPVGLTKYHRPECRLPTDAEMHQVLEQVTAWQRRLRERLGVTFAYLSDEWYLRLEEDVPGAAHYDGLDLTENGVGLVRQFLDGQQARLRSFLSSVGSSILVSGTLFAPVLCAAVAGLAVEVVPVVNRFFGSSVTVSGLLTARDVIATLERRDGDEVVILPSVMFEGPDGQSLDGMRPLDVERALGRPVIAGFKERGGEQIMKH